jgi:hypothetical protein
MSLFSTARSLMSALCKPAARNQQFSSLIGSAITRGQNFTFAPIGIQVRGTKMKTRQAAAKRFIPTGRGGLKRNHCGKVIFCGICRCFQCLQNLLQGHLTGHMSAKRTMRLNNKV